jgi:putative tryptophan/tyrosine transport system substrate-binding protein
MRRREFFTVMAGAAAAWRPLAARAQQTPMPVLGWLNPRSADEAAYLSNAFRQGLRDTGYSEGRDVTIAYRWGDGHYDRMPALAADLVNKRVNVIAATGGVSSALAAKKATTTIPIVFVSGDDPVVTGLVASLNRPGGNVTGVGVYSNQLGAKRLELLHELVPDANEIAFLINPTYQSSQAQLGDAIQAAQSLGIKLRVLKASTPEEIDAVFADFDSKPARALLLGVDPFFTSRRDQIIGLAARHTIPTIYYYREYVAAGGLISYAPSLVDGYRQVGVYCGRILKGEKPGDIPVVLPTKFEFVINMKTAKALGLQIPSSMQLLADEVIE